MKKILPLPSSLRGATDPLRRRDSAARAIQTKTHFYLDCRASLAMTIGIVLLLLTCLPAQAQPVESEPLGPAPYTLQNETDPMALDSSGSSAAPTQPVQPSGFAPIPQSDDQTPPPVQEPTVEQVSEPQPVTTSQDIAPSTISYPKTNVSGVIPEDPSKFENRVFCTLKISFGSYGEGVDQKAAEKIKSYLDAHSQKLTYTHTNLGLEGEHDYCVKVSEHKDKAEIYKALKKMIPPLNKKSGPVRMTGDGFASVNENIIAPKN